MNLLAVRSSDGVVAVLLGDALGSLLEGFDGGIGPPLSVTTLEIVLGARVVKCICRKWNTGDEAYVKDNYKIAKYRAG